MPGIASGGGREQVSPLFMCYVCLKNIVVWQETFSYCNSSLIGASVLSGTHHQC